MFGKGRKPIDRFEGLTEEEQEAKIREFGESDFEKTDMLAIILAALRVFLPPVLLLLFGVYLLGRMFM